MSKLENLTPRAAVRGILPGSLITVVSVQWFGSEAFPGTGKLRFIEVKGRVSGSETITVTRNEILYSLNKPHDFILALVEFFPDGSHNVSYVRRPFRREPDFGAASVNYYFTDLLAQSEEPAWLSTQRDKGSRGQRKKKRKNSFHPSTPLNL